LKNDIVSTYNKKAISSDRKEVIMPEEDLRKSLEKLEGLSPEVRARAEAAAKAAIDSEIQTRQAINARAKVETALKKTIESELAKVGLVSEGGGFSRGLIFSKAGGFSKGVFFSKDKGSIIDIERIDERIILEDEAALQIFAERLSNIKQVKDLRDNRDAPRQ
jgi:hypothetical protein